MDSSYKSSSQIAAEERAKKLADELDTLLASTQPAACKLCYETQQTGGILCGRCAQFLGGMKALRQRYPEAWVGFLNKLGNRLAT